MDLEKIISEIHFLSQEGTSDYNKVIEKTTGLIAEGLANSVIWFYRGRSFQELGQFLLYVCS